MTHRVTVKIAGLQPVQVLAALTGIAFIVFGVVGFMRTGGTGDDHAFVLGFAVNPMHNAVHVVFGVLGLLMAMRSGLARLFGWLLFLGYGAVFVWGLMIAGVLTVNPVSGLGNPLALNMNDNWLHLGLSVLGLLMAVLPARRKLIEEDDEHDVPQQRVDDRRDDVDDRRFDDRRVDERRDKDARIEQMDPTVSSRPTQELPKQKKDSSTSHIKA